MRMDRASILVARRANPENFVSEIFENLKNQVFLGFAEPLLGRSRARAQGVLLGAGPGAGPDKNIDNKENIEN